MTLGKYAQIKSAEFHPTYKALSFLVISKDAQIHSAFNEQINLTPLSLQQHVALLRR
jgi:hypothetical protein